ncbi:hypothetical protein [Flavobacterium sp.]|uniref:hypothetical protein n=1 Tax=Flavobacterium sp. TaxID=239 RepID=UPI0037904D4F
MKTLKLIAVGIVLFASSLTQAQISVNLNIGTPPSWGPSGYSNVQYYYLPDVQAYYDIRAAQFIYLNGGVWIHSRNLPGQYRNYDLYNGYKVVLNDYHGTRPYTYFKNHRTKYYRGYKGSPQSMIGNRDDNRGRYNNDHGNNDNRGRGNNDKWNNGNRGNDYKDHGNYGNQGRDNKDRGNNDNRGNDNKDHGNQGNQGRDNKDRGNDNNEKDNRGQGNDKH